MVGVIPSIERRKGLSGQAFNLVVTTHRLVFARVTSRMLRAAAEQAKQAAKEQGSGFFGQWGAVMAANATICERYYQTPVEAILREHPDNFGISIQRVQQVQVIEGEVDEDEVARDTLAIHAPEKMTFTLKVGAAAETRQTLRKVLGQVVE